jgi:hypothetical protein
MKTFDKILVAGVSVCVVTLSASQYIDLFWWLRR